MKKRLLWVLGWVWSVSVFAATGDVTPVAADDRGYRVNAYVVETRSGLIVIDTQFLVPDAQRLIETVQRSGRPLRAVIVTHPHPDHYNGIAALRRAFPQVPVHASQATIAGIRAVDAGKRGYWKPIYGTDYPDELALPDAVLPPQGVLTIDGLRIEHFDLRDAESETQTVLVLPAQRVAFVADLVSTETHAWLAEGRSVAWLEALQQLGKRLQGVQRLYPGHGPSASPQVLEVQARYIRDWQAAVRAELNHGPIDDPARKRIRDKLMGLYPNYTLPGIVDLNIDGLVNELAPKK